ncbi:MAG: hypothetical protein IT405_01505, partial [Candidatus Yanofskybacteria bacterium]|nr:hypothetical protein [Candidatus Yanofskybacteria bacterium]
MTGAQAVAEDPAFFAKVFCINTNEFTWYTISPVPYTALAQVPSYRR